MSKTENDFDGFEIWERKPPLVSAVLVTYDNIDRVAAELSCDGYQTVVSRGRTIELTVSIHSATELSEITVAIGQMLIVRPGLKAQNYDDFRKDWRRLSVAQR